jgi:hypothetical protein
MQAELEDHLQHWSRKAEDSAYDCVFKIRCSKGLSCRSMVAPWPASASSEDQSAFELPRMSPDTTVTFVLSHEPEEPDEDDYWRTRHRNHKSMYVQTVVLHTNRRGQRLLRVHNTAILVTASPRQVFGGVSMAPLMAVMLKQACLLALNQRISGSTKVLPRDFVLEFCLQALASYSRHCGSSKSSAGCLVLGRRLCLLPLLTLAARKLMFLLTGGRLSQEEFEARLRGILRMPVHSIMSALYPRIYALPFDRAGPAPSPACPTLAEYLAKGLCPTACLVFSSLGSWIDLPTPQGDAAPPELTPELWQNAEELNALLCNSQGTAAAYPPIRWLPRFGGAGPLGSSLFDDASWEDKVLLSTLFVEDEGATEMGYSGWVQFLREELARSCERE